MSETAMVPCTGCGRELLVPRGPVVSAKRRGKLYHTYCSRRCQRRFVAQQGALQQDENARRRLQT